MCFNNWLKHVICGLKHNSILHISAIPFYSVFFSEYFASISLTNELNSSMCNKMLGWILKPMPSIFFTTVLLRVMWSCISRQSAFQCLHALQAPVAKGQCIPVNAYIWWNVCMHTYMHFCNGIISTLQSFCTVCLDANIPTGFLFFFSQQVHVSFQA